MGSFVGIGGVGIFVGLVVHLLEGGCVKATGRGVGDTVGKGEGRLVGLFVVEGEGFIVGAGLGFGVIVGGFVGTTGAGVGESNEIACRRNCE